MPRVLPAGVLRQRQHDPAATWQRPGDRAGPGEQAPGGISAHPDGDRDADIGQDVGRLRIPDHQHVRAGGQSTREGAGSTLQGYRRGATGRFEPWPPDE